MNPEVVKTKRAKKIIQKKKIPAEKLHVIIREIVVLERKGNNSCDFPVGQWNLPPQKENYLHCRKFDLF